jgi:hypothetical protein
MKEAIKHFACLLAVALACVTMTACGSDDDDDPDDPSSLLVGTWETTNRDGSDWDTDRIILKSDGTGNGIEHYASSDPDQDPDPYTFHWSYNASTKIFTFVEDPFYDSVHDSYDDSDTYYYYVSEINATSAILYEYENGKVDYGDPIVWTRVK